MLPTNPGVHDRTFVSRWERREIDGIDCRAINAHLNCFLFFSNSPVKK